LKKRLVQIALALLIAATFGACTKITTGHVGVRTTWSGEVVLNELGQGWHQTIFGDVDNYVANEITLCLDNLHPQTKDRSVLNDLDLCFAYSVDPTFISEAVTKYKGRDLKATDGSWLPVGAYVQNVVTTATTDVVGKFDSLVANENRDGIRLGIKTRFDELLAEEGIKGKVRLHQVFIKNLQVAESIQQSALAVINQSNVLAAKTKEVETARKEAERMEALARTGGEGYVKLLNAQTGARIADAIYAGKVHTVVVPSDFKGIISVK
jgi:hypothetical protein